MEVHHSGFFCRIGRKRIYLNEKIDWFDYCNNDTWSLLWVDDFLKQLNIVFSGNVRVYWCVPNHSVGEGLRPLKCDAHIVQMNKTSQSAKNVLLYVDHHNLLESQRNKVVDDPLFDGQDLPTVTLNNKRNKLHVSIEDVGSDDNSDTDIVYVDSDYEIDNDDDDLYVHNIDDTIEDEMSVKNGNGPAIERVVDDVEGSDTPNVEELQLPSHEDKEAINFNFHTFKADIDLKYPIFRVGMIFADVVELRKVVDSYSLKNRRPIRKIRNEKNRLEAVCIEGCPWILKASFDNRSQSMLVKHYDGQHTCNSVGTQGIYNTFSCKEVS